MRPHALRSGETILSPADDRVRSLLAALPEHRYGILGVDVRLRTDSEQVGRFFDHAYRWFAADDAGDRLELSALLDTGSEGPPRVYVGEKAVSLAGSPSPANQAFLALLGAIMDGIHRSLLFHGAAVACDGKGVILAGPAFAGKSTLVMALMDQGCDFLSDDAAPVDRKSGALQPYPRAVGVRKPADGAGAREGGLPGRGLLELPHRWLVDPEALGARLPAADCRPEFLFYLDPEGWSSGRDEEGIVYEIVTAADPGDLRPDLEELGATDLKTEPARPFPTLSARFTGSEGLVSGLVKLQRKHRNLILFLEQRRPPVPRPAGSPRIERAPVSSVLIPLIRDLLNRGDEGRLMEEHGGKVTSLMVEAASLLGETRCYRVSRGDPRDVAAEIMKIVQSGAKS